MGHQKARELSRPSYLRVTAKEICGLSRALTNSRPGPGQPIATAQLGDAVFAAQAFQHNAAEDKIRLAGDTARAATSDEVKELRREAGALKEVVAELTLENRLLKKSVTADGEDAFSLPRESPSTGDNRGSGRSPRRLYDFRGWGALLW